MNWLLMPKIVMISPLMEENLVLLMNRAAFDLKYIIPIFLLPSLQGSIMYFIHAVYELHLIALAV